MFPTWRLLKVFIQLSGICKLLLAVMVPFTSEVRDLIIIFWPFIKQKALHRSVVSPFAPAVDPRWML
jgi:hypothetical protein